MSEKIEISFESRIDSLMEKLTETFNDFKTISNDLKIIKKEHNKIVKKLTGRKKIVKDPDAPKKAPSGFCKPRQISVELAKFLKVEENTLMSNPEVTKMLNLYIIKYQLQKKENNTIIELNKQGGEELRKLLKVPLDVELSFFNISHYTKNHFIEAKPEAKPEDKPEDKPEAKPEVKPEEKSEKKKIRKIKMSEKLT